MNTTPGSGDDAVIQPDGLVVGERPILRVQPSGHTAAVCDPDDLDDAAWHASGGPAVRCVLFWPGHNVHWIQARKGLATPAGPRLLLAVDGQWADLRDGTGALLRWRFHDTTTLSALLLLEGPATVYLHDHGLLRVGRSLLYPCLDQSSWTACRSS